MLLKTKLHILLIEDNHFNSRLIVDTLAENTGVEFTHLTTETLAEGIEVLTKGGIDLILLDLNLPDSRGIQTLDAILSYEENIPIIIISAIEDETTALEALSRGASDYLIKGHIDNHIISRSIRYTIEAKQNDNEIQKAKKYLEQTFGEKTGEPSNLNHELHNKVKELIGTEEKLKESVERYKGLFENSIEAVFTVDLKGTITSVNNALSEMSGYTVDELTGMNFHEITDKNEAQKMFEAYNRLYLTGEPIKNMISHMIHKNGETRMAQSYVNVIRVKDKIVGFQGTVRDITEQQRMEAALIESEQRLKLAVDAAQIGLWDWDIPSGRITRSEWWFKMLGYSLGEIESTREAWSALVHPDDLPGSDRAADEHLAGEKPFYQCEFRMRNKSGEYNWILDRGQVVAWDDAGNPIRALGTHLDITERKKAEEAVRESEERFRNLFENSIEAAFTSDLKGNFTEVNTGFETISGYSREELIGLNFRKVMSRENAEKVSKAHNHLFLTGEPIKDLTYNFIKKDGSERTVEAYVNNFRKGNKIVGFQGTFRDITERKLVEEALRESEEKYRIVVENAYEGIGVIQDFSFKYVNRKLIDLLGYPEHELIGKTVTEFIQTDYHDEAISEYRRKIAGDDSTYASVLRVFSGDGEEKWIEVNGVQIFWEGRTALLVFIRDITEHRQAEEELRRSEEKWLNFFETSRDIIFISDINGNLFDINPIVEEIAEYRREELIGKSILGNYVDKNIREKVVNIIVEKGFIKDFEVDMRKKDGTIIHFLLTANQRKDKDGKMIGLQGTLKDITEKKKLEQQLIQAQKMEAIVALAGGIAHNFNNILVGIMGYSELLLSRRDESDPDYKALYTIHQGTLRASELTRQLLDTARAGQYNPKIINLNTIVHRVLPLCSGTFDKSIEIRTRLHDALTVIEGDAGQLEQSLLNLCINARDAMPNGGKLLIETFNQTLDEHFVKAHVGLKEGNYVVLSITDTGIGIAPEIRDHIFEPFFTTKEQDGGTGMGLATVYGIVKNHKGQISFYSEKGKGTTFKLYFPAEHGASMATTEAKKAVKIRGEETILIIDDEPVVREMWRDFLTERGYTVITAEDGQKGIETFRERKDSIDLVILDLIMPKLGGKETLQGLRKIKPEIKVIVSSGYSQNGQAKEIMLEVVNGFIQKPAQLTELAEKIDAVLSKGRKER